MLPRGRAADRALRDQDAGARSDEIRLARAAGGVPAPHPRRRDWWCQGYSEPGAGSDLASLKTKAERDGDHYVVNGQKTWTTLGQYANRIFCLVRTKPEGKPQEGISFLLIDLDTPGIEMRPIRLIEGGYEVNEVFFTDVRVPVKTSSARKTKAGRSRNTCWAMSGRISRAWGFRLQALEQVKSLARTVRRNGKPLIQNTLFAARIAAVEAELEAMKITNLRMLARAAEGGKLGAEPSMLKIKGTQIRQTINDLARRALGPAAAPFPSEDLEGNLRVAPRRARQ
jgi:alkylation response protein AidB-like acyl-CoA dehydrogenase